MLVGIIEQVEPTATDLTSFVVIDACQEIANGELVTSITLLIQTNSSVA